MPIWDLNISSATACLNQNYLESLVQHTILSSVNGNALHTYEVHRVSFSLAHMTKSNTFGCQFDGNYIINLGTETAWQYLIMRWWGSGGCVLYIQIRLSSKTKIHILKDSHVKLKEQCWEVLDLTFNPSFSPEIWILRYYKSNNNNKKNKASFLIFK